LALSLASALALALVLTFGDRYAIHTRKSHKYRDGRLNLDPSLKSGQIDGRISIESSTKG
jgi:hypothetical protein